MKPLPARLLLPPTLAALLLAGCAAGPEPRPLASGAAPSASGAPRPGTTRGTVDCRHSRDCGTPSAPAPDRSARLRVAGEDQALRTVRGGATAGLAAAAGGDPEVEIEVARIGSDGRRSRLASGSALAPGERFAVFIRAREDAHVYLWHQAPDGRLQELIASAAPRATRGCAESNLLRAGEILQLPYMGGYYSLDSSRGSERFSPVVSRTPRCGGGAVAADALRKTGGGADCAEDPGRCPGTFVIRRVEGI